MLGVVSFVDALYFNDINIFQQKLKQSVVYDFKIYFKNT